MSSELEILKRYVSCPSVSADPAYAPGMAIARELLIEQLTQMGLTVQVVSTPLHPIILAKREGDPHWPHVVVYGHYDVQPPDPLDLWETPPFEPVVRDNKLWGRGSCDNKGPLMVHIFALAKLLKEQPSLPLRITFLIEGEEEIGSPSFEGFLQTHKDALHADCVFMSDTQSPALDQLSVAIGLRGVAAFEVEVSGPKGDLHSGLHGGAILNPVHALCELCASLHNPDGTVNVPGFYDDVATPQPWELEAFHAYPRDTAAYLKEELGAPSFHTEPGYGPYEAIAFRPTLEINGIGGGYQGPGGKTIIPAKAFAKITTRLVPGQTVSKISALVERALHARCPAGVRLKVSVHGGGDPYSVTAPGKAFLEGAHPTFKRAVAALEKASQAVVGSKPVYLREGGSIPILAKVKAVTGMDVLMLGLCVPGCDPHAPNENFDLRLFDKGIEICKSVYAGMAQV